MFSDFRSRLQGNVVRLSENAAVVTPNPPALGYVPPNTVSEDEQFVKHISGYGSGDISVAVIDPFAITETKEYQIVFDTLQTADDLTFSVRNQELIIETLTINSDSSAITTYDNIDAKISINSTIINDSTVYDTINPVSVTNVDGTISYNDGEDYNYIPELGLFIIKNPDLLAAGEDGSKLSIFSFR